EVRAEADQSARWHRVLDADAAAADVIHAHHHGAAHAEQLGDDADVLLGHVYQEQLHRFFDHAVALAYDRRRLRHLDLVALAAHGLDQDGELQLAATEDAERVGRGPVLDAQADVPPALLDETLAD